MSYQFKNNYFAEMGSGSEAGSYFRLIYDVSLNSRLESHKEEEEEVPCVGGVEGSDVVRWMIAEFREGLVFEAHRLLYHSILGWRVIKKKKKSESHIPHRVA